MGTSAGDHIGPPACMEQRCNQNTLAFQDHLILKQLMLTRDPSGETEPFEPPTLTSTGHSGFKGQTISKRTSPIPMLQEVLKPCQNTP